MRATVTQFFIDSENILHAPGTQIEGSVEFIRAVVEAGHATADEPFPVAEVEKPKKLIKRKTKKEE